MTMEKPVFPQQITEAAKRYEANKRAEREAWMEVLMASAADIRRARKALEKDPEIEGYCWNFEEAQKQILNTLANIKRELGSEVSTVTNKCGST